MKKSIEESVSTLSPDDRREADHRPITEWTDQELSNEFRLFARSDTKPTKSTSRFTERQVRRELQRRVLWALRNLGANGTPVKLRDLLVHMKIRSASYAVKVILWDLADEEVRIPLTEFTADQRWRLTREGLRGFVR
jgi:hypothetical protein